MPGDAVGNLEDIDKLIYEDHQPAVACLTEEISHELEIVVPVVIGDDHRYAELLPCLCLRGILAAEPFEHLSFELVVSLDERAVIEREETGEVEAVDELLHLPDDGHDTLLYTFLKLWIVHADVVALRRSRLHRTDPSVKDHGQGTALRFRLHTEVADQLAVGGKALPLVAVEPALRREVGIDNHELPVHDIVADGLKKKRLTTAVFADNEPERGTAFAHDIHVVKQRLDLFATANGDERQTHTRYHTALERTDDALGDAPWDLYFLVIMVC